MMSTPTAPLLFPVIFDSPGLHAALGPAHGLHSKDFDWLAHAQLATQSLRNKQTPPMLAERILLNADKQQAVPLKRIARADVPQFFNFTRLPALPG